MAGVSEGADIGHGPRPRQFYECSVNRMHGGAHLSYEPLTQQKAAVCKSHVPRIVRVIQIARVRISFFVPDPDSLHGVQPAQVPGNYPSHSERTAQ